MSERVRNSFGKNHYNKGGKLEIKEDKFSLDNSREFYLFDVIPMGAVRMTVSDKWKTNPNHIDPKKRQRKAVVQYFAYKTLLQFHAKALNYTLENTLDVVFFIPMPNSWSNKKKEQMNGMPCKSKPDTDNLIKGLCDALRDEDSDIWWQRAEKRWAYKGSIIIYG